MKTFSTDNIAAIGSSRSSQSREAAFITAHVRCGGRGNSTIDKPNLVTWPFLNRKKSSYVFLPWESTNEMLIIQNKSDIIYITFNHPHKFNSIQET